MTIVRLQCDYLFGKHFVSGLLKDQTIFWVWSLGREIKKICLKKYCYT